MTHPRGVVDGIFAGTDPHAVYKLQLSEIHPPHIPALAELPAVGPHATGIGKVIANIGLPFELRSYGWQLQYGERITSADQRRAQSHRDSIIQALVDVAEDQPVSEVSVRLLGPVTTMINGMLPSGQRILRDPGARRDIAAAWAEALHALTERIHAVIGAHTTVFIQEDQAQQAIDGQVRSVSGVDLERALDRTEVRSMWAQAAIPDATVLFESSTELSATAAEVGSVALDWPTGSSEATESTWELIDKLTSAETPVALHISPRGEPKRYAETLIQQYLDWGLSPSGLEHVRLVRRFAAEPERTVGAGLEWFITATEHAAQYLTTL